MDLDLSPSGKRNRIGRRYFEDYNKGRPYGHASQWTDQNLDYGGMNIISYWNHYCERHCLDNYIESLLDIGAADGSFMHRLQTKHPDLEIHGIESSTWGRRHVRPDMKDAILFDDWLDVSRQYEDNEYDIVLDFVSQYIPADNFHWSLAEMGRVARRAVITVFAPSDNDPAGHTGQIHCRPKSWWRKQVRHHAQGPVECYKGCNLIWRV